MGSIICCVWRFVASGEARLRVGNVCRLRKQRFRGQSHRVRRQTRLQCRNNRYKGLPIQKLVDRLAQDPLAGPAVPSVSGAIGDGVGGVPAGLGAAPARRQPRPRLVELSKNEERALAIGDEQRRVDPQAAKGNDARVTFVFGEGLPTVITAPFHVSIVELEPGETITGPPAIGDSVRWEIAPGTSGTGPLAQPLVIVKPHDAGLDTNLVIMTNKRTYYLRLVSRENDYIARIGFSYKEDEDRALAGIYCGGTAAKRQPRRFSGRNTVGRGGNRPSEFRLHHQGQR